MAGVAEVVRTNAALRDDLEPKHIGWLIDKAREMVGDTTRDSDDRALIRALVRGFDPSKSVKPVGHPERLVTSETATYLGVSMQVLANWRSRGIGPAFEKQGRTVLYNRADLDSWLIFRKRKRAARDPYRYRPRRRPCANR